MSQAVWPMPVSVEQIAVAVRCMSPEDRRRLVALAPELQEALTPARALSRAKRSTQALRKELLAGLGSELLQGDQPFLGHLTLAEYGALPDQERARLWAEWSAQDWSIVEEVDVALDAMPAG